MLPWLLATLMGPLGLVAGTWLLGKDSSREDVNVRDVQSKWKIEVYDESGTLIDTLPYTEMPKAK